MVDNTELIDITNEIVAEEDPCYFNDEESLELYQTGYHLMEEFVKEHPTLITEPDFHDIFDESIEELMHSHFDYDIFYTKDAEDEMEEIIEHTKEDFFKHFMPYRSYSETIILQEPNYEFVDKQIHRLREKPQPIQRTKEWYEFRHNLITASNAYKAFESQSMQNQLIYEKCKPLKETAYENTEDTKEVTMVNVNTTLHWGQKYEPLSVQLYEDMYNTKIEDFGCIQHEKYSFLGASPDGINVDKTSERYGRMLEIKNIVNRVINGIPKKEYWIQMQLQMEVCDLDECDFLETKFTEYPDYSSYKEDTSEELYEDEEGNEFQNPCLSKDNKRKGSIIYFHTKEGKPFYKYRPFDIIHPNDIQQWQEKMVDYYQCNPEFNYTYIKMIYWKLEEWSCVLVCRNKQWFKDNIGTLEEIWRTIEKERTSGYEHRAPNRRPKCEMILDLSQQTSIGCLLQFDKISGKTIIKSGNQSLRDPNPTFYGVPKEEILKGEISNRTPSSFFTIIKKSV
jgi:putative phage-type endonuclease